MMFPAILALSCVAVSGCERSDGGGRDSGFIAFVGAGQDDPLWPVLSGTAEAYWRGIGAPPRGLRVEAPPIVSVHAQAALVRALQADGMRALCIHVIDPPATRSLLEQMRDRGVTVITVIRPVTSDVPFDHCGWDDQAIPEALMEELIRRRPDGDDVALMLPQKPTADASQVAGDVARRGEALRYALTRHPSYNLLPALTFSSGAQALAGIRESLMQYPSVSTWLCPSRAVIRLPAAEADTFRAAFADCRDPLVLTVHPLPDTWPAFERGVTVVAVGAQYGDVAPEAIARARHLLLGGGAYDTARVIPLRVVDSSSFPSFRQEWESWCAKVATSP